MSSWAQGSFGVNRKSAEKFIWDRIKKKPEVDAPGIDFDKMKKGPEQVQHPQFHGPLNSNTLPGDEKCSQSQ